MYKGIIKRMFDIVFSIIALPLLIVTVLILAPLIYFEDKGSIFYNADRVGKSGKVFKMYKFRSMCVNAPDIRREDGSTYNSNTDARVTKIGRFIRKTSIDELPQILNILKGDMSFVGPRPNLPTICYDEMDVLRKKRLNVRPGLTGYSQAYKRNSATVEEKLKNDIYYVENISLFLDIKILFRTIYTVIRRENVYAEK